MKNAEKASVWRIFAKEKKSIQYDLKDSSLFEDMFLELFTYISLHSNTIL
jgi:hypothetical protein